MVVVSRVGGQARVVAAGGNHHPPVVNIQSSTCLAKPPSHRSLSQSVILETFSFKSVTRHEKAGHKVNGKLSTRSEHHQQVVDIQFKTSPQPKQIKRFSFKFLEIYKRTSFSHRDVASLLFMHLRTRPILIIFRGWFPKLKKFRAISGSHPLI